LQHRNRETMPPQRVGCLHADISRADHDSPARLTIAQKPSHAFGIVDSMQRKHVRLIYAFYAAAVAARPGRDHEFVVAYALARFKRYLAPRMRDRCYARARADFDIPLFAKVLRRVNDQLLSLGHTAFHEVGKPAGSVRNIRSLFEYDDFEV